MANITGRKFGGRKKGTPNKITKELRASIIDFLEDNFKEVAETWNELDSKDKLTFYKDLLQYAVPKLQNTSINTELHHDPIVLQLPKGLDLTKRPKKEDFTEGTL